MNPPSSHPPEYEPGGNRLLIAIALIVVTALGGMLWSFFSRHSAPPDAPPIKARHLPPSAQADGHKPASPAAVAPAPTVPPSR